MIAIFEVTSHVFLFNFTHNGPFATLRRGQTEESPAFILVQCVNVYRMWEDVISPGSNTPRCRKAQWLFPRRCWHGRSAGQSTGRIRKRGGKQQRETREGQTRREGQRTDSSSKIVSKSQRPKCCFRGSLCYCWKSRIPPGIGENCDYHAKTATFDGGQCSEASLLSDGEVDDFAKTLFGRGLHLRSSISLHGPASPWVFGSRSSGINSGVNHAGASRPPCRLGSCGGLAKGLAVLYSFCCGISRDLSQYLVNPGATLRTSCKKKDLSRLLNAFSKSFVWRHRPSSLPSLKPPSDGVVWGPEPQMWLVEEACHVVGHCGQQSLRFLTTKCLPSTLDTFSPLHCMTSRCSAVSIHAFMKKFSSRWATAWRC